MACGLPAGPGSGWHPAVATRPWLRPPISPPISDSPLPEDRLPESGQGGSGIRPLPTVAGLASRGRPDRDTLFRPTTPGAESSPYPRRGSLDWALASRERWPPPPPSDTCSALTAAQYAKTFILKLPSAHADPDVDSSWEPASHAQDLPVLHAHTEVVVTEVPEEAAGSPAQPPLATPQEPTTSPADSTLGRDDARVRAKRWYREPSIIISIVALLSTLAQALHSATVADRKTKIERLDAIIAEVVQIREQEVIAAEAPNANPITIFEKNTIRNGKRQILLDQADSLVVALGSVVTPQILLALSSEHFNDSRFKEARMYATDALARTRDSTVTRIGALTALATLYQTPGTPFRSDVKAHEYWAQLEMLLSKRSDEYGRLERFWMHRDHLYADLSASVHIDDSVTRLLAIQDLAMVNPSNSLRPMLALQLASTLSKMDAATDSLSLQSQITLALLTARVWKIQVAAFEGADGVIEFRPGTDLSHFNAAWTLTSGGILKQMANGAGTLMGRSTLRVVWNGVGSFDGSIVIKQATGVLDIDLNSGDTLLGTLRPLDASAQRVILTRHRSR